MLNPTELMQSILTSEEAQIIIDYLSPIYGEARVFLWLLQSIGVGLDEAEACKDDFDLQSLVAKATWSLKYYEEQYGITTNSELTDEQRRGNIFASIRSTGPLNKIKMEAILSSMAGCDVRIEENTGINTFSVISDITDRPAAVDAYINRVKPAHLIYDFSINPEYQDEGMIYTGDFAVVENEIVASNNTTAKWSMRIPAGTVPAGAGQIRIESATYSYTTHDFNYFAPTSATVDRCDVQNIPDGYRGFTWNASVSNDHMSLSVSYWNQTEEAITISEAFYVQVIVEYHY